MMGPVSPSLIHFLVLNKQWDMFNKQWDMFNTILFNTKKSDKMRWDKYCSLFSELCSTEYSVSTQLT